MEEETKVFIKKPEKKEEEKLKSFDEDMDDNDWRYYSK